jgi:hypothetical protein
MAARGAAFAISKVELEPASHAEVELCENIRALLLEAPLTLHATDDVRDAFDKVVLKDPRRRSRYGI